MKKFIAGLIVAAVAVTLTACDPNKNGAGREAARKGGETVQREQEAVQTGFNRLSTAQQIPSFDWSQERQTLIDVETIRATGATSTTAGYLENTGLVWWCPSAGAPVPSTYQLSASDQYVDLKDDETRERFPTEQGEPTGVYVGDSAGTWVLCLDDNGQKFGKYWEGPVDSTIGVVNTYPADKRARVAQKTFKFKDNPNK